MGTLNVRTRRNKRTQGQACRAFGLGKPGLPEQEVGKIPLQAPVRARLPRASCVEQMHDRLQQRDAFVEAPAKIEKTAERRG
ncbi:MAG TPA: hypothetical protein VEN28_16415, partial [Burkholderiaceae bacterium]|nr:hypothetical protein [Burkholderiaceae bacterium]